MYIAYRIKLIFNLHCTLQEMKYKIKKVPLHPFHCVKEKKVYVSDNEDPLRSRSNYDPPLDESTIINIDYI